MFSHRRSWLHALLVALVFASSANAQSHRPSDAAINDFLHDAREKIGTPGLSAAIVLKGELIYVGGAGLADLEQGVPARAETVYRIGSISKPIAATAVMQLVEQQHVSLDDPIQRYVPDFPEKEAGTILIRHILTHTSGIRHYRGQEMLHAKRHDTLESAIQIFRDDPLEFAPGSRFSYSSFAFNLLQGVVEHASELSFEDYLRQHVWQPAGMRSTRFDRAEEIVPHRARPYDRVGTDGFGNSPYVDLSLKWAGGGMISTAEDLARFDLALQNGTLISPETLEQMYAPQLTTSRQTTSDKDVSMALGWFTAEDDVGRVWIWHAGGSVGARTILLRCPVAQAAVIVLTNCSDSEDVQAVARQLLAMIDSSLIAP